MGIVIIAPIVSSRRNGDLKQAYVCDVPQEPSLLVSLELQCY